MRAKDQQIKEFKTKQQELETSVENLELQAISAKEELDQVLGCLLQSQTLNKVPNLQAIVVTKQDLMLQLDSHLRALDNHAVELERLVMANEKNSEVISGLLLEQTKKDVITQKVKDDIKALNIRTDEFEETSRQMYALLQEECRIRKSCEEQGQIYGRRERDLCERLSVLEAQLGASELEKEQVIASYKKEKDRFRIKRENMSQLVSEIQEKCKAKEIDTVDLTLQKREAEDRLGLIVEKAREEIKREEAKRNALKRKAADMEDEYGALKLLTESKIGSLDLELEERLYKSLEGKSETIDHLKECLLAFVQSQAEAKVIRLETELTQQDRQLGE